MSRPRTSDAILKIEQGLLGALIRAPDAFFTVSDILKGEDFTRSLHRDIFGALETILTHRHQVTFAALQTHLPTEDEGGENVAAYLAAITANAENLEVEPFAQQLVEAATRRRSEDAIEKARAALRKGERPLVDTLNELEEAIVQIKRAGVPKRPVTIGAIASRVVAASAQAFQGGRVNGYETGLVSVDEILGLIMPGDLGVILASQGDGKTSLAAQMCQKNARQGRPSVLFELEMEDVGIAARELAGFTSMSVREIREGAYTFEGFDEIKAAEKALQNSHFYVLDEPRMTVRQMRTHCLAMKRTIGLGMVAIDHFRLIRSEKGARGDQWERGADILLELRVMAKELEVPVVLLVQRTRTGQRRSDDPTPHIDDAKLPEIEQDADWVLGLWRWENWLRRNKPAEREGVEKMENWKTKLRQSYTEGHAIGLKVRSGRAYEQRKLGWDGRCTRFYEISDASTRTASLALAEEVPL